jgi:hypothetical protein
MISGATLAVIASILGITVKDLFGAFRNYLKKSDEDTRREILAARAEGEQHIIAEGLHTEVLLKLYDKKDLNEAGLSAFSAEIEGKPVFTSIVGKQNYLQLNLELLDSNEECILKSGAPESFNIPAEIAGQILADIEQRELRIWDAPIYNLTSFSVNQSVLRAEFVLGHFMQYRLSLGALWDELVQALIDSKYSVDKLLSERERCLSFRQKFLSNSRAIADYSKRICVGGVNVMVALQRPDPWDDFAIPVQRRSAILSEGQNMISLVPQAFHQHMIDPYEGVSFSRTIYRELFEELFGGEEATKDLKRLREDWYMEVCKPFEWLRGNRNHYRLVCTGFGLNLMSGTYEIAILLIVRNPSFWKKFSPMLITNWETAEAISPLISSKDAETLRSMLSNPAWTGASLFSLCLGLCYLSNLEPSRVNMPNIRIRL